MDPQTTTLILSGLTAIATVAAAAAAIFGPRMAAKYALQLQEAKEVSDRKFTVFLILMTHRKSFGQPLAAQHLNAIDVLWRGNRVVKDRWAELHESLKSENAFTVTQQEERLRRLLQEMAVDLKLGDGFTADDYARVYYSNALGWQEQAEALRNRAVLQAAEQYARENQV